MTAATLERHGTTTRWERAQAARAARAAQLHRVLRSGGVGELLELLDLDPCWSAIDLGVALLDLIDNAQLHLIVGEGTEVRSFAAPCRDDNGAAT